MMPLCLSLVSFYLVMTAARQITLVIFSFDVFIQTAHCKQNSHHKAPPPQPDYPIIPPGPPVSVVKNSETDTRSCNLTLMLTRWITTSNLVSGTMEHRFLSFFIGTVSRFPSPWSVLVFLADSTRETWALALLFARFVIRIAKYKLC